MRNESLPHHGEDPHPVIDQKDFKPNKITGNPQNALDLELVSGAIVEKAIPPALVGQLAEIAGTGPASNRTGIRNHVENVYEGWTGTGWPPPYFDRVAAAEHDAVTAWRAIAYELVTRMAHIRTIEQARSRDGKMFTPAVVRETTNGIGWHFDHAHLEYPGTELDLGPGSQQYSVITYLSSPQHGELEVATWKPASAGAHPKDSYPLNEALFSAAKRIRVQPLAGRTAILSSEFAHRVHPTPTPRRFITMFVAVSTDGYAITFG
ncbi:hypothetical protein ACFZDG_27110 [Kitasatospora xanthocidica]|uniref:hypothetical protein n=1 Tax=Kitasatospora xanthocidica TaxID=83382 RepID=UPI0036E04A75